MKITLYFLPTKHTTTPNFGKMHINPVIAFRSSKVPIAIKTINATLGKNGQTLGAFSHL